MATPRYHLGVRRKKPSRPLLAPSRLSPSTKKNLESCKQLDDPRTTLDRQSRLRRRGYLREVYLSWYHRILKQLPPGPDPVLELGSGGGFLGDLLPGLLTSDVLPIRGVRLRLDAAHLPFHEQSLRALVGTNVLHHFPSIGSFFSEAQRVLVPGGRMVFIEPWPTPFAKIVYSRFHHEPFEMGRDWTLPPGGPLTAANGALPWILLERDRTLFQMKFPKLIPHPPRPFMPFSYLAGGGIQRAWPVPSLFFRWIRLLERPWDGFGLFAELVLEKETDLS